MLSFLSLMDTSESPGTDAEHREASRLDTAVLQTVVQCWFWPGLRALPAT